MARRVIMGVVAAVATLTLVGAIPILAVCNGTGLYPDIADTSHASPEAVEFFRGYFTAKSSFNASEWLSFFNPRETEYYDSTLGVAVRNWTAWKASANAILQGWAENAPDDRSYPLRILGDTTTGAVVYYVDTPGLFGDEIRSLSSVDFLDGTVRRQVDNWDGRGNVEAAQAVPDDEYPYDLGLYGLPEVAAAGMSAIARQLNDALSAGNATAAAALFNYNAIFEDLTLRVRVEGRVAIQAYLQRTLQDLPYGQGANLTHVLGNIEGGGYEWRPGTGLVRYGLTALELDCSRNITRFTAAWDGSRLNGTAIEALAVQAPTT